MDCLTLPNLVFISKAVLQLLLFIFFLIFFGIPSLRTYQKKDTIVVKSEMDTHGIEAPAVTIQAVTLTNASGWKNYGGEVYWKSFEIFQHCSRSNTTILKCVQDHSIDRASFLKNVRFGDNPDTANSDINSFEWTEDLGPTAWGRAFTMTLIGTKLTQDDESCLKFVLEKQFQYNVFVHDEDFNVYNNNPLGIRNNHWSFEGNKQKSFYQEVILTKKTKLNLEKRPCEEDSHYSFTVCVKENLSAKVYFIYIKDQHLFKFYLYAFQTSRMRCVYLILTLSSLGQNIKS